MSHRPRRPSTCHARDAQACGLVKNLALSAHVSTDDDEEPIRLLCFNLGVEDVHMLCADDLHARGGHLVFLNGVILGVHRRPQLLLDTMRRLRRAGQLPEFVSIQLHPTHRCAHICWPVDPEDGGSNRGCGRGLLSCTHGHTLHGRCVHIASDSGRVCRPLLVVEDGKLALTARHLEQLQVVAVVVILYVAHYGQCRGARCHCHAWCCHTHAAAVARAVRRTRMGRSDPRGRCRVPRRQRGELRRDCNLRGEHYTEKPRTRRAHGGALYV